MGIYWQTPESFRAKNLHPYNLLSNIVKLKTEDGQNDRAGI